MSNIAEELKKKCGGKGQTIAEVVKTMEGGGVLVVNVEVVDSVFQLNKTWQEIKTAFYAGMAIVIHDVSRTEWEDDEEVVHIEEYENGVHVNSIRSTYTKDGDYEERSYYVDNLYVCDSPDHYPHVYNSGDGEAIT